MKGRPDRILSMSEQMSIVDALQREIDACTSSESCERQKKLAALRLELLNARNVLVRR
jgi:hypothetical protein